MKTLLKRYDLTEVNEYYQLIADSFINGQRKQAIEQFKAMPKADRVYLCIDSNGIDIGMSREDVNVLIGEV